MSDEQALVLAGVTGTTRRAPGAEARAARGLELTPEMLAELRPHVVNLNQGRFSDEGLFRTSQSDVDTIFDAHLVRAADAARANGRPLRLLFWAHGGLISESTGLWIAHLQVAWWKKNDIYPIHFVWEIGFVDALKQILSGARGPAPRGVPREHAAVLLIPRGPLPATRSLARTPSICRACNRSARHGGLDRTGRWCSI